MFQLNNSNKTFIFLLLYLTLLLGFFLDENSSGGALNDFKMRMGIIEKFDQDFKNTLLNYHNFSDRHSPIILILLSLLTKLGFEIDSIRFIHLNLILLIIIFSYKCLKIKFSNINKNILFLIPLVFLLSPSLRSIAIWPDSRVLATLIFLISLFFFLKFKKNNKFVYCIYNNIFLIFASYISPNFSIFFIYFFYYYLNLFKLSKKLFSIILINILLSLPMFIYLFIFDVNFLFKVAIVDIDPLTRLNLSNKILIISSLIFFYLIPFSTNQFFLKFFKKHMELKHILMPLLLFCFYFLSLTILLILQVEEFFLNFLILSLVIIIYFF